MDDYGSVAAGLLGALLIFVLIAGVIGIVMLIAGWKIFTKADKPGWAILVPYYNFYVVCEIGGTKIMWFVMYIVGTAIGSGLTSAISEDTGAIIGLLSFVASIVGYVAWIVMWHNLFKSFGYGAGMTVLFVFLPFIAILILGFGSSSYLGPGGGYSSVTSSSTGPPTAANAPPEMGRVCPNCGHMLQPGESFCTNCGAKLG